MARARALAALALVLIIGPGLPLLAEAPMTSLRPQPKPGAMVPALAAAPTVTTENTAQPGNLRPRPRPVAAAPMAVMPAAAPADAVATLRPRARPAGLVAMTPVPDASRLVLTVAPAGTDTLRPKVRPAGLAETILASAAPASTAPETQERRSGGLFGGLFGGGKAAKPRSTAPIAGSVCGDPAIRGDDIARIKSDVQGCGVEEPVRVTAIDGIRLNSPATIDCPTALALRSWVDQGLRPAFRGKEIVELRIAASYICRPRNNVRGNRVSEHGRGKAVDVAGVVFSDGSLITVEGDYGASLRRAHKAACGIFGTTLGPGSDGYHEDHLHFDTASYRNGPYCR